MNERVTVVVYVTRIRTIRTKRGEPMAFLTGSDETADVSITIFPNQYRRASEWLKTDQVIVVRGKVEQQRGLQIVADQLDLAEKLQPATASATNGPRWFIRVDREHDQRPVAQQLAQVLTANVGSTPVIVYQPQNDQKRLLPKTQWLRADPALKAVLERLMGVGNVVFKNG